MLSQKQRQNLYWQHVIKQIEKNARRKMVQRRLKNFDFYTTLPPKLRERVADIIPMDQYDDSPVKRKTHFKQQLKTQEEEEYYANDKEAKYNESTCSLIEQKEQEYPNFTLNLENVIERQSAPEKRKNWYSKFICAKTNDRVKWKSKIYAKERNFFDKPVEEQAEILMDASAEKFTDWFQKLGTEGKNVMSKEQLKSFFEVEGNYNLLAGIITDPKEVKAIGKTVADAWNLPDMASELKYEQMIKSDVSAAPKRAEAVAFGRTIPYKDRPWIYSDEDAIHTAFGTVFPDELRSGKYLFDGIAHLRSTRALIEHCKKKPNISKPRFLMKRGYFGRASKTVLDTTIPLYKQLKLK